MKAVVSYGGGVQSQAMGRKIVAGVIAPPALFVFADTQQEPAAVYEAVAREFAYLREHGFECVTVTGGDLGANAMRKSQATMLPLYTINLATGEEGQLHRVCSERFKTRVVNREIRRRGWHKEGVEMWLGISTDEIGRVKPNPTGWITNRWPLIEANVRRSDCEALLRSLSLPIVKSACTFCPYRRAGGWRSLTPDERAYVIRFDARIRDHRPGFLCFVHDSRRPISEVFAALDSQPGPFSDTDQECDSGVCFV